MKGSLQMRHLAMLLLVCVFCVALVGCGGGAVTTDNYNKIEEKAKLADVEKIMGGKGTDLKDEDAEKVFGDPFKAAKILGSAKAVRWGDDNKYIAVLVVSDVVVAKEKKGL